MKSRPGRPPLEDGKREHSAKVRAEDGVMDRFRERARSEGRPISHVIGDLLVEYLEREGGSRPPDRAAAA